MKRNNLIKAAAAGFFLFAILILLNLAAAEGPLSARLTYGNVDLSDAVSDELIDAVGSSGIDAIPAFSLTTTGESITIAPSTGEERTNKLMFVSDERYRAVYFNNLDEIMPYDGDSFTLNGIEYTIERSRTGTAAAYRVSSTESGSLMIRTRASNTLVLPDSGMSVKIVLASGERTERLPTAGLTVLFNSRAETDVGATGASRAAGRGSVSGTASEDAEPGCIDNDESEDDDGIYAASHVSVVSDDGAETITSDYCARRGDVTRLYEAVCTAEGTATVRMIVCPEDKICKQGACREPNAEIAGKYCLDSDVMTADNAEALSRTVSTKGTTVGFYTATCTGENECMPFSAWSDYCRDSKTLIEYYCSDESRQGLFREIICLNGCTDGICAEPPYCYDSDGGPYENVKGTIRGVNATGEYFVKTDSCKDANTVVEYRCTSPTSNPPTSYLSNGFGVEEKACGEGKHCSDGKCVSGEMLCNQCDPLNDFNIREGTACNADETPSAWNLKRCPAGKYCSANTCVDEPKATIAQVTGAFDHRKKWALLLNETLSWIETAKQIEPIISPAIISPVYGTIMEEIATGLSGTQTLLLRREIQVTSETNIGDDVFRPIF